MTARTSAQPATDFERRRFIIDHHYTVDELEWNRIVGTSGVGRRLLDAMAELSSGRFDFDEIRRVPMSDAERFEFQVDGQSHSIQFDYDVSPTSTLLKGLRQLFAEVNTALRRAGVHWLFVLTRSSGGSSRSFDYRLVLAPRSTALEHISEMDVVAGLDMREFEMGRP